MLPVEDYEEFEADMIPPSPHGFKNRFFKRLADEKIIQIEVILITQKGQAFRTTRHTIGITQTYKDIGAFKYLGFGTNKSFPVGQFYYPKGTEFVAIKVRANTPIEIPYLAWFATLYYQKPDKTWDDVNPSATISFD